MPRCNQREPVSLQNTSGALLQSLAPQRINLIRLVARTSQHHTKSIFFVLKQFPLVASACVKSVYTLGTRLVQLAMLLTGLVAGAWQAVHITRLYPPSLSQLCHRCLHSLFVVFTPVIAELIPTIHSTYNKQLQIR